MNPALFLLIGSLLFTAKRLLRYLRYLQQEEYDSKRFVKWIWMKKAFDRKGSLIAFVGLLTSAYWMASVACSLALVCLAYQEEDPRFVGKLKLKMTERAKRIYGLALGLAGATLFVLVWMTLPSLDMTWLCLIVFFQAIPAWLILSCFLLSWEEQRRQKQYLHEAKQILAKVNPFVIGITGSYGKTSTKHALSHILQVSLGPTFWPAKGINTPMGNTREIRERLRDGYQYAVIEMGAYGIGSIKRLCDLTPPHAALITHIGTAHLERFKTEETIRQAKAELAQAVPQEGILVCNGDNAGARQIAKEYPKQTTLLYGFDQSQGPLDCWISSWQTTANGTVFTLRWKDKDYQGRTSLFGKSSLSNLAGAFTMACALGSQPELVLAAIYNLEPYDNRLQVKKEGTVTYVRDAYNSNPVGFSSALEVLKALPGQRRILMTPGMIELGHQQHEQNEKIGHMAAQICDFAVIVGQTNRHSLATGLAKGGLLNDKIQFCSTREEAFAYLRKMLKEGDVILIENDLGDLYETPPKF